MKAYKYLFILIACAISAYSYGAKTLDTDQQTIRLEIFKDLKAKGYNPDIDSEGDVAFTKDGTQFYVIVNENWTHPFLYTVYAVGKYNNDRGVTKRNLEAAVSLINQNKGTKIYCYDNNYAIKSEVICENVASFGSIIETLLKQHDAALKDINELAASGLLGMDLTGNKDAIYDNAIINYSSGDYFKAFKILSYLADEDYHEAYGLLGSLYEEGLGVAKNESQMMKYYDKAIDAGELWAAYRLGDYFYSKRNYDKAFEMFTQCSGNENSYRSDAYYMVGMMAENGQGTKANINEAIKNYRQSVKYSKKLDCDARVALIRLKEQVENPADFIDLPKSLLVGLTPEELYIKGNEYENGLNNRDVSLSKAFGYYKAAYDKNYPKAFAKMGEIYISDFYPFKDKAKSDKYYEKAFKILKQSESSDPAACYQLGKMYAEGRGVTPDMALSVEYFRKASGMGSAEADYELGKYYLNEKEYVEAFRYFNKAAENNIPEAMLEVAKAYETGMGVNRNRELATMWYRKCSNTFSKSAKEATAALKRLGKVDDEKE